MEWTAPVNDILSDKITKLNYTLIPPSFQGDVSSVRLVQHSLSKLIDTLGELSASDQNLSKIITTAEKLRNTPSNILYLLKDPAAKGGKGEVIGLLKIGRKHLFLFDEQVKVHEVEPLCVLDFYVQKDRQRHGYGKILFDHMLQDNGVAPQELAIDGPSAKMEQFLRRGYGIDRLLRQNNNFAVSPDFFNTLTDVNHGGKSGHSTPVVTPGVGRFAAPKPHSTIATVIHGADIAFQQTNGSSSGATTPEPNNSKPDPVPETEPTGKEIGPPSDDTEAKDEDEAEKQKSAERPSTLSVEPITESAVSAPSPAGSTIWRRDSQLTDRGYFDVKFYHNKLW